MKSRLFQFFVMSSVTIGPLSPRTKAVGLYEMVPLPNSRCRFLEQGSRTSEMNFQEQRADCYEEFEIV